MERADARWEYLTLTTVSQLDDERLNARGREGWELVSTVPLTNALYYVFKRPAAAAARPMGGAPGAPPAPPRHGAG